MKIKNINEMELNQELKTRLDEEMEIIKGYDKDFQIEKIEYNFDFNSFGFYGKLNNQNIILFLDDDMDIRKSVLNENDGIYYLVF